MRSIHNLSQPGRLWFSCTSMFIVLLTWLLLPLLSSSVHAQGTTENPAVPKALGEARSIRVAPPIGALSDRIPISVSPGRRNVEPRLALTYSSMAGFGDVGLGWQIEIGRVERWRGDGTPTVVDPDSYSYSLSGAGGELIQVGNGVYRARLESVYREFRRTDAMGAPCASTSDTCGWEMRDGEGSLHRFGGTPEGRIDNQTWMLDLVQDLRGNTITYHYQKIEGTPYLTEIRYTGFAPTGDPGANRVLFEYEDRPDLRLSWGRSVREELRSRLRRISIFAGEALVRRYELAYEKGAINGQSLLARVNLVGADDVSRIMLRTIEYGTRPQAWSITAATIPVDLADSDGRETGVRVVDVNGDGLSDIVDNGANVYLGDGHGHFIRDALWSASLVSAQINFVDGDGADKGVRLVDINADQRPDLFIASPSRREVRLNTGMGWSKDFPEARQWTESLSHLAEKAESWGDLMFNPTNCTPPHCGGQMGDFPNCSPPEALHPPDCDPENPPEGVICLPPHCSAAEMCGPGSLCDRIVEPFSLVEEDNDSKGVQLADVNGDGRLDIVWSMRRSEALYWWLFRIPVATRAVFLNTGSGWEKSDLLTSELWSIGDFVRDSELEGYDVMDVNGDGLADIVRTFQGAQTVLLGTGRGWTHDDSYSNSLATNGIMSLNSDRKNQGLMPIDFDDDGLVDYLVAKEGAEPRAYRNTGMGWEQSAEMTQILSSLSVAFATSDGASTGVTFADIEGNGISDILMAKNGDRRLWLASGLRSGLMVQATSALGEVTEIDWASSASFNNVGSGGIQGLPSPMPVVTGITHRDGRGNSFQTRYEYAGGLFENRQFRGFAWSRQWLPSKLCVETWYHQEEGIAGQLDEEAAYDDQGRLRAWKRAYIEKVQANPLIEQVQLLWSEEKTLDPGGSRHSRVVNTYDERLHHVSVERDPDVDAAGDETTTYFSWARNDSLGIYSLPARIQTRGPDGSILSESILLYDGLPEGKAERGLASETLDLVEAGTYVTKQMEYDQYGNVIRVRDRAGNVTEFEYGDPTMTFRTKAVDPEGRTVRSAYDPRFGFLVRDEDASRNVTTKEYDPFGRLVRERLPGDEDSPLGTRTYTFSPLGDATAQFYHVAETETAGQPGALETWRFFDGMGQIYRVEREGSTGRRVIVLTEFDDAGNAVVTSRPFSEGDTAPMSLIERDELHRPVRVTEPDGIAVKLTYAGARADVVDRRGSKTSYYRNTDGKVTEIHEWVDGVEQVTRYQYDPLNRLISIVDALGSETRIAYDALGRRVQLEDPNAGTYKYEYDGEGRLIEQIGPDGGTTTFRYNRAGDLLRKEFPDGTANVFTYGRPGRKNGVGRVIRTEDAAGVVEMAYDPRGNVAERRRTVLGTTYVTGYNYDSLGRIRRIIYPDGFIAHYEYGSGGNLARVSDGQGQVIAEGLNYNAAGQYGGIGFGNGVRSSFTYDSLLRMTSIRTVTASGGTLQSLDYAYDAGSNILSIADQEFGASQEFEYDSIGRLIQALGPYGEERYEYDVIGNLLRKGSLVYTVDPMHPQRVIFGEDTGFGRGKSKGRSFHLSYDALGNVVEKGDRRFEYDSENHLVRILDEKGRLLVENVYDSAGHRVIQRTQEATTIFIDGIYEDGKTHASRHVRVGSLLLATVVTPRATVRLISDVREASIDSSMTNRWLWLMTALLGVLVSALALIPVPGRGGPIRRWFAGLAVVGAVLRRHPGKLLVLLLIPVFVLVTSEPLLGGTVSGQKDKKPITPSEKRYYYHSNHLGSVNVVTDEKGKVVERRDYKPYGDPFDWTGPRSGPRELLLTFDSQRYDDATGFYYFGARHYDPQLGRFLTADTQVPDPMNPKTLHRYAFAGGNPIRYSDPTGHAWYDWLLGIFIVIALVVIGAILTIVTFGAAGPPLLVGLTLGLAFLGAGVFAAVALARGFMPTSSNFWLAVAGGFALGAAIGAGLAALPTAIAGGFWASIAASALVGAVMGGIETAIVHFVNGGSIEGLFGALFNVDALISAGIGAAFGLVAGFGFGWAGIAAKTAATAIKTTITVASGLATLLSTWSWFYAGFMGRSFTEAFWIPIPFLGLFMNSPPKSLGIPAWAFSGTWSGSAGDSSAEETAVLLHTMPLAL